MSRIWVKRVSALAVSNLFASASTYLVFVVASRNLTPVQLGTFAVATALYPSINQLVDGGSGVRLVRDVRQHPDHAWLLNASLRRRMAWNAGLGATTGAALVLTRSLTSAGGMAFLLAAVGAAFYGLLLIQRQAQESPGSLVILQTLNGAIFLTTVGAALVAGVVSSVTGCLMVLAVAFTVSVIVGLVVSKRSSALLRRPLRPSGQPEVPDDSRHFFVGVVANIVSASSVSVILGPTRPGVVAAYAVAERPTMGLASLSNAVGNYVLPRLAVMDADGHRQVLARLARMLPLLAAAVAVVAVPVVPLIRWMSGDNADLVEPGTVLALLVAYAVSLVAVITGSALAVRGQSETLRNTQVAQAILSVLAAAAAVLAASALVAAVGVMVARLTTLLWQWIALRDELVARSSGLEGVADV